MSYKNQKKLIELNKKIDKLQYEVEIKKFEADYLRKTIGIENEKLTEKQARKIARLERRRVKRGRRFEQRKEAKIKHRQMNEPPALSVTEEVGNAVTHGLGAVFAAAALVLLLLKSDTALKIAASLIYGISIFVMMLSSCLYHSFKSRSKVKRVFRRFDYSSIYLLIGGTFAPLFLVDWGNAPGIIFFVIQWTVIVTGIAMVCIFGPGRLKWLHFPLYFVIGWSGLMFLPGWIASNLPLLFFILGGGAVYTAGMIPFLKRGVPAAHFIWHFFVLFGCAIQFVGIYLFVY